MNQGIQHLTIKVGRGFRTSVASLQDNVDKLISLVQLGLIPRTRNDNTARLKELEIVTLLQFPIDFPSPALCKDAGTGKYPKAPYQSAQPHCNNTLYSHPDK
jgi:hypothetical protein